MSTGKDLKNVGLKSGRSTHRMILNICVFIAVFSMVFTFPTPTTSTLALQQGDMQWSKVYGGAEYDSGNTILEKPDGGYILMELLLQAEQAVLTHI